MTSWRHVAVPFVCVLALVSLGFYSYNAEVYMEIDKPVEIKAAFLPAMPLRAFAQKTFIGHHLLPNEDDALNRIKTWSDPNRTLTVVTGYIALGSFPKGFVNVIRTPDTYRDWLRPYGRMLNPVIFYTDSVEFANLFAAARKSQMAKTEIMLMSRDELWSFHMLSHVRKIFSRKGYPKHYPNTHVPEYACMTHSKIPLLEDAVKRNTFSTKYYSWIDLGYFKNIVSNNHSFWEIIPRDFNDSKIGVTKVAAKRPKDSAKTIIYRNLNWIAGGIFIGKPDVILKFANQYKQATLRFLDQDLMNAEQQILHAMYTDAERKAHPLDVDVQPYVPGTEKVLITNHWLYLGYLMYQEIPN